MKSLIYIGFKNTAVKSSIFGVFIVSYFYLIFTNAASTVNIDNVFFVLLPFIVIGAVTTNIYYTAEHSHWHKYMDALPIRRSFIVSQTYLISLILEAATLLASAVIHRILTLLGIADIQDISANTILLSAIIAMGLVGLMYFFVFTINYTSGIIVYMITCGAAGGMMGYIAEWASDSAPASQTSLQTFLGNIENLYPVIAASCIAVFILSWIFAVTAYKRKEF